MLSRGANSFRKGVIREIPVCNAYGVDPDQTPRSVASDLGLHCLPVSHLWDVGHKLSYSFRINPFSEGRKGNKLFPFSVNLFSGGRKGSKLLPPPECASIPLTLLNVGATLFDNAPVICFHEH